MSQPTSRSLWRRHCCRRVSWILENKLPTKTLWMSFPICGSSHSTCFYASLCVLRILLACGDAIVKFKDKRKLYRRDITHENLIKILNIDSRTFFVILCEWFTDVFLGSRLKIFIRKQTYVAQVAQELNSEHVRTYLFEQTIRNIEGVKYHWDTIGTTW